MLAKDYYNIIRKEIPNKLKPKTIMALLRMLEDNGFSLSRARDARACRWQASEMMDSHLLVVSGVK
jgi:hypothetical protein